MTTDTKPLGAKVDRGQSVVDLLCLQRWENEGGWVPCPRPAPKVKCQTLAPDSDISHTASGRASQKTDRVRVEDSPQTV